MKMRRQAIKTHKKLTQSKQKFRKKKQYEFQRELSQNVIGCLVSEAGLGSSSEGTKNMLLALEKHSLIKP